MDWGGTISLKAWIGAGPSLFEEDYFSLGWDNLTWMCSHWTRDTSLCALTLRAGPRSLHVTRGMCLSNFLTQSLSK